eukprot:scaffold68484_cov41-Cyclotella_meneghiniana.AAC.3
MHRRNAAERAIQTFKSHFKSVLAGVSDNFELLPQASDNHMRHQIFQHMHIIMAVSTTIACRWPQCAVQYSYMSSQTDAKHVQMDRTDWGVDISLVGWVVIARADVSGRPPQ